MHATRPVLLVICWTLVFVALIANAFLQLHNVQLLAENEAWVAHTQQVKVQLIGLMRDLTDAETGVRGFVIASQEEFLKLYEDAERRIVRDVRLLEEMVADNPAQQSEAIRFAKMFGEYRGILARMVAARREQGLPAVAELMKGQKDAAFKNALREQLAAMIETENRLLAERAQAAQNRYRETWLAGAIGTVLSVAMLIFALVMVWREWRRRHAAEVATLLQAEESRINAERFRLLSEAVPIHIWIAQPLGGVHYVNRSWQDFTGLSNDGAGRAAWLSAFHAEDRGRLQAILARKDGGDRDLYVDELRLCRQADQSYRWHRCALVPMRTRTGILQSWVGTLVDIQDQKDQAEILERAVSQRTQQLQRSNEALYSQVIERTRAEELARTMTAELRRSNEELEKFAYVASHDLQEPLRKIQAFGDRLLRKSREHLDEQGQTYLDRMLSAATRMRTLIDDLLSLSRIASTARCYISVDLNGILAGVSADLEAALAQSQGRIEAKPMPTLAADPLQMRQLFQNLIGNALKFARPGAPPVVSIEAAPLEEVPAGADPPPPGFPGWRLVFADNGIGFEQVHEKRIFEVFQRLHGRDEYAGTGIGLAICRKIVERHGGQIHARSQQGKGAIFYVDLPRTPAMTTASLASA